MTPSYLSGSDTHRDPRVLDFDAEGRVDLQHMQPAAFNPGEFAGRMHARATLARDMYAQYMAQHYESMRNRLLSKASAPTAYIRNPDMGSMKWDFLPSVQMPDFSSLNLMGAFSDLYATPDYQCGLLDDSAHRRYEHQPQYSNDPFCRPPWASRAI